MTGVIVAHLPLGLNSERQGDMMKRSAGVIPSKDFDRLVSQIAADIWNHLIDQPRFHSAAFSLYADIFESVAKTLRPYGITDLKDQRRPQ
jgi:hypothetical protein